MIDVSKQDIQILWQLGRRKADIAADPRQAANRYPWTRLNDLDMNYPAIYINKLPWNEMDVDDELTLRCASAFARGIEDILRKEIYCWDHLPGNMVVNPYIACPVTTNLNFQAPQQRDNLIQ